MGVIDLFISLVTNGCWLLGDYWRYCSPMSPDWWIGCHGGCDFEVVVTIVMVDLISNSSWLLEPDKVILFLVPYFQGFWTFVINTHKRESGVGQTPIRVRLGVAEVSVLDNRTSLLANLSCKTLSRPTISMIKYFPNAIISILRLILMQCIHVRGCRNVHLI